MKFDDLRSCYVVPIKSFNAEIIFYLLIRQTLSHTIQSGPPCIKKFIFNIDNRRSHYVHEIFRVKTDWTKYSGGESD